MEIEQRLINANAVKDKLQEHHDFFVDGVGGFHYLTPKDKARVDEIDNCIAEIVNAPTVDAAPVVHGQWEQVAEADYKCSVCGFRFTAGDPISMFQYCRCGAKMDGG